MSKTLVSLVFVLSLLTEPSGAGRTGKDSRASDRGSSSRVVACGSRAPLAAKSPEQEAFDLLAFIPTWEAPEDPRYQARIEDPDLSEEQKTLFCVAQWVHGWLCRGDMSSLSVSIPNQPTPFLLRIDPQNPLFTLMVNISTKKAKKSGKEEKAQLRNLILRGLIVEDYIGGVKSELTDRGLPSFQIRAISTSVHLACAGLFQEYLGEVRTLFSSMKPQSVITKKRDIADSLLSAIDGVLLLESFSTLPTSVPEPFLLSAFKTLKNPFLWGALDETRTFHCKVRYAEAVQASISEDIEGRRLSTLDRARIICEEAWRLPNHPLAQGLKTRAAHFLLTYPELKNPLSGQPFRSPQERADFLLPQLAADPDLEALIPLISLIDQGYISTLPNGRDAQDFLRETLWTTDDPQLLEILCAKITKETLKQDRAGRQQPLLNLVDLAFQHMFECGMRLDDSRLEKAFGYLYLSGLRRGGTPERIIPVTDEEAFLYAENAFEHHAPYLLFDLCMGHNFTPEIQARRKRSLEDIENLFFDHREDHKYILPYLLCLSKGALHKKPDRTLIESLDERRAVVLSLIRELDSRDQPDLEIEVSFNLLQHAARSRYSNLSGLDTNLSLYYALQQCAETLNRYPTVSPEWHERWNNIYKALYDNLKAILALSEEEPPEEELEEADALPPEISEDEVLALEPALGNITGKESEEHIPLGEPSDLSVPSSIPEQPAPSLNERLQEGQDHGSEASGSSIPLSQKEIRKKYVAHRPPKRRAWEEVKQRREQLLIHQMRRIQQSTEKQPEPSNPTPSLDLGDLLNHPKIKLSRAAQKEMETEDFFVYQDTITRLVGTIITNESRGRPHPLTTYVVETGEPVFSRRVSDKLRLIYSIRPEQIMIWHFLEDYH